MANYDQLGLVRNEIYRGRYHSFGIYRKGTDREFHRLHTEVLDGTFGEEDVLVVKAAAGTSIGETALYAAFLHHTTGEKIRCRSHYIELGIDELEEIPTPYMSDSEIAQRFKVIQGADSLTEVDKRTVAVTALLVSAHFMKLVYDESQIAEDTLQFDEEF
jgi:hypothetical protein